MAEIVPEIGTEEIVQRIKYDNLSAEEFYSTWQACANYRDNVIQQKLQNIHQIFREWPEYKKADGYRLIDLDFGKMFANTRNFLCCKQEILRLFLHLKKPGILKDSSTKFVINSISEQHLEKDETQFIFKTLWCLHGYLYPTSKVFRKTNAGKKDTCRFTIEDSQESFTFVGQTLQELDNYIEFLKQRGESIQPLILVLSETFFSKFDEFFLYLDDTKMRFTNFYRCVDVCFKSFHLFNVEYPTAISNFWTFIEAYFYNFSKSRGKTTPKINILIQELEE
ncbi:PREDICTED: uncharacterized protein LOC108361393 [Rhagoletis zephyria]|uniref:uncharacterized protein LOC108361393 n=1 Tax=Rhagoletis zephyria TaxID=28612 RepID=UPI00081130C5|nr:PREDICTED: uncharacterized protein LOC108361393 [Rhagoletis zephyria]XP_017469493.1 PREDICTED: uncharacterized protein LOC108361393 [Rhagoletis zephyria]XP_017469494.1 PREDICTED: uncharacterized protein LOC108361393 [Rhagoletis zephyria]